MEALGSKSARRVMWWYVALCYVIILFNGRNKRCRRVRVISVKLHSSLSKGGGEKSTITFRIGQSSLGVMTLLLSSSVAKILPPRVSGNPLGGCAPSGFSLHTRG